MIGPSDGGTFVPTTQRTRVLYWRLSDFKRSSDASYSKLSLSIYYAKTSNCRHLYSITVVLPPSASITITDWPLRLSQTSKPNLEGWEPGTPLLQSHGNDRVGTIAGLKNYQNSTCNFEGQTLTIWLRLWTTVKLGVKTFFRTLRNFASQTSLKLHSCIDINTVFIDCRSQWDQSVSLLICTLRSDFEGGRKVVLQTWIFCQVGEKRFCKLGFESVVSIYKTTVEN